MNISRTVFSRKVYNLLKHHTKIDHRIYSSVCLKLHTNHILRRTDRFDDVNNINFTTGRIFEQATTTEKPSILKTFLNKVGWLDISKGRLKFRGYMLYESVVDELNYSEWFRECDIPDTFYSWFVITELHIWMILVRCMAEGAEGRFLRNCVIEALWSDVSTRAKKMDPGSSSLIRSQVELLSQQFQAAIISYDEGLMSDDKVLAGALWRRIYQMSSDDPILIENLVKYIRKQILLLENIPGSDFLENPEVKWISLKDKKV